MADSSNNLSILREQAFRILTLLKGNSDIADKDAIELTKCILGATSEADLNHIISVLNAIAASRTEPHFIDD